MVIILQNKRSSSGMLFGVIALTITLFHFTFGPFDPPQHPLESVVAEHVSAVKQGIMAGLKGEVPADIGEKNTINSDKLPAKRSRGLAPVTQATPAFCQNFCFFSSTFTP